MSDNKDLPQDPFEIGDEFEIYLETHANFDYDSDEVADFEDPLATVIIQLQTELQTKGVDFGLIKGKDFQTASVPEATLEGNAIYNRRYLVQKIALAVTCLEEDESDEILVESLASVATLPTLTTDERGHYLEVIENVVGAQQFEISIRKLSDGHQLEVEKYMQAKAQREQERNTQLRQGISDVLMRLGIPFDHDDFQEFTGNITDLIIRRSWGLSDQDLSERIITARAQAVRLGLQPELFKYFGLDNTAD